MGGQPPPLQKMKQILTNIIERLSEIPELKYVDENWGQAESGQPNPIKYPMALIDVESTGWSDMGNHAQSGQASIVIAVSALRLGNTSHGVPEGQRDHAFAFYDLMYAIHCKLHHWKPADNAGRMVRLSQQRIRTRNGVKTAEIVFGVRVTEALPNQYQAVQVEPVIRMEQ